MNRIPVRIAGVVGIAVLGTLAAGCGSSTAEQQGGKSPDSVSIVVQKGKVQGGVQKVDVKQGTKFTLNVRSDVADEIHLHGYDKHADVEAGGSQSLAFTADTPGVFEAELEDAHLQLVQLQVR